MPALLTTTQEFQSTALGARLLPYCADLQDGELDRTLMQMFGQVNRTTHNTTLPIR